MNVAAIIMMVLVVTGGGSYWYLTSSPTTTAFLHVESGDVQVDQGSGWETASDGMDLSLNDQVKTGEGKGSVVLYESIIVELEQNSQILLKELSKVHPKIEHTAGSTWNKFTGLTGLDTFSVETPNTVATVRGTEFGTFMDRVIVGEGTVQVDVDGTLYNIKGGKKLVEIDGVWTEQELTAEEKAMVRAKMQRTIEVLRHLRQREIEKKSALYGIVKSYFDVTDSDVQGYLLDADAGQYDLDEIEAKSPIDTKAGAKVRALTEQIMEQNKHIAALQ